MYLLYTLLYCTVLVFLLPFQYLKRPKKLRKRWLREKFVKRPKKLRKIWLREKFGFIKGGLGGIIWIHAVSVGEVMAAIPLLKKLREKYPSKSLMLSTITDTGQKVARERAPEGTMVFYLPFDIPIILKRVFERMRSELLITIETELWPNLFRISRQYGIPVVLLNGRISEKSFKGYKKASFFMKEVLSNVDLFCMQSEMDAERISSIGVNEGRIKVLGNFKFDIKPPSKIPEWSERMKGPVLIAGSTHEGEEEFLISVYMKLKKDFTDLNLILAPRHPERFKDVENLLRSKGVSFIKRSAFSSELPTPNSELKTLRGIVILLDTVGELSAVYGISDIAIIGKSFKGYGGPEKAKETGLKAQQLYKKNTGAVDRAIEVIAGYIS